MTWSQLLRFGRSYGNSGRRARTARSADPRNGEPAATRSSKRFPAQQIDVSCDIDRPCQRVLAADRRVHLNRKGGYHEKICRCTESRSVATRFVCSAQENSIVWD